MKKILSIVGVAFISGFSLTFLPEIRFFFWGMLSILFLFSIGVGFWGVRWLQHYVGIKEQEKLLKQEEVLNKKAERKKNEVHTVILKENEILHIKENGYWRNASLDRRLYANGEDTPASDSDIAAWMALLYRKNPNQLPSMIEQPYEEQSLLTQPLPEKIELSDLLPSMTGSLRNIVLGVRIDDDGQQKVVSSPMFHLCHIGVAGATDGGKSNFGRVVAYQIATSHENSQMILSDLKGTTFKTFSGCKKLLYPIINTVPEFLAVMGEVKGELDRRKELFRHYPTVETLTDYNNFGEPLPFIIIFIDEITNLFLSKETQEVSLLMLREARAFGMYFLAMGQSWSHKEMNTSMRQQFRTRLHFGTDDDASSRMMVHTSNARGISIPGRAIASLPFRAMSGGYPIEIQTPHLSNQDVFEVLNSDSPSIKEMPEALKKEDREARIFEMVKNGASNKEIGHEIFEVEYPTGNQLYKINKVREMLVN